MFDIYYSKNVYGIEGGTFSPGSVYLLALDDATGEFTLKVNSIFVLTINDNLYKIYANIKSCDFCVLKIMRFII